MDVGKEFRDMARKKDRKKGKEKKQSRKKVCMFCTNGVKHIDYKDIDTLRRFVNDKGKIIARRSSGACAKHQRAVARAIKLAREAALLPYCTTR